MAVLQKVRLISNERIDLPDFLNLDNFACADWGQYFEKFMGNTPFVIKGFEILNPSPLIGTPNTEVSIVIGNSVMFHPTSTNVMGGFFVATASEANQTVALTPNATNFIELDQVEETGAPDTRAVWDPSAEGGAGAEFSQIIDTVTFLKVEVSVNTVGFSAGKIPIAKVTVNNGVPPLITSITDSRPMFFRLGSGGTNPDPLFDFVFPDSPSGYSRTETPVTITSSSDPNPFKGADKNIVNFKEWMNAVMTRIKEITGSPFWYKDGGLVSGLSLSNVWWDAYGSTLTGSGLFQHSGGSSVGTLTFGNITILDGETFTIDDGVLAAVIFEFDNDGSVSGTNVPVVIGAFTVTLLNTVDEFKDAAISAINGVGAGLAITANDGGTGIVGLTNDEAGPHGNVAITETVADAGFVVSGMAGGDNVGTLTWTSDIFVRSIIGAYYFRIAASSIFLPDDSVAYVEQVRGQPLPAGASVTWVQGKDYVNGVLGSFAGLTVGDFIRKQSDGIEKYVRIADFRDVADGGGSSTIAANALSVRLETVICVSGGAGNWQIGDTVTDGGAETCVIAAILKDVTLDSNDLRLVVNSFSDIDLFGASPALSATSGGTGTFDRLVGEYEGTNETIDGHYAKSVYTVSVAKREAVPAGGDTWWLAFRDDNGSNIAKIYIGRSGQQLEEGEEIGISDQPPIPLLNYIGSPSQTDETPDYNTQATDSVDSQNSYNTANGENLTARASKLTSMVADKAQDKNIKMLMGSTIFSWNLGTETLSWDSSLTFQIPSSNDDNTLASSSAVIGAGQVAYVDLDRNNPLALTNSVVDSDAVPLKENVFVWARRDGNDVLIGHSFKLRPTDAAKGDYSDHLQQERMLKPVITQAAADDEIHIYPAQRVSGNKRRYTYVSGLNSSKFPRDGSGLYDGGVSNENLTTVDFDPATSPGSIEVGVTFPSIARAVSASFTTPSIGQFRNIAVHMNADDSLGFTSTGPFASLALAQLDDNLPAPAAGSYSIANVTLEATGATAIAAITDDRLLDRRPSGQGLNPDFPTADYDKHQDALTENTFKEIFINILEDQNFIDATNSANMTFDAVQKALQASTDGSFVSYSAKIEGVTPESAVLDPWVINGDASLDSVVANRLRINDSGGTNLFYSKSETSVIDKAIVDLRFNVKVDTSSSGVLGLGAGIEDDTKFIRVAIIESGGSYLIGFSNSTGTAHIGTPTTVDFSAVAHGFRILKVGDRVVQFYVDGSFVDVLPWSSFSAASTPNRITFGTDGGAATSDSNWGEFTYCAFPNVHATTNIIRQTDTVALTMDVLPESATPAWTKDGGESTALSNGKLVLTDSGAGDYVNYSLTSIGIADGFKEVTAFDCMFQVSSWTQSQGALDAVSFIRIQDGYKEALIALTYDGVNSGIALADDLSFATVLAGTSAVTLTDVNWTEEGNSIRVEHTGNVDPDSRKISILVNRDLRIEVDWTDLNNSTNVNWDFGSGSAAGANAIATTVWDDVYVSLPGEAPPVELPVHQFLATVTTDDPHPIILFSSDNGNTWCDGENGETAGLDFSLAAVGGGEVLTMIGLSNSSQLIDDYSIMYSREKATGTGFFKYYEFTAAGGETLIALPFSYAQGNKELEVIENGVELYDGVSRDYIETSPTSITFNTATDPGDLYKFRVNHRIILDENHLDGGANKHDASEIDVEGTLTNAPSAPTDLETVLGELDSAITGSVGGSTRRQITDISGGSVAPASGAVGASLGFFQALKFDPSTNNDILFQFSIPDNCDIASNIVIRLTYAMGATNGGDIKLDFDYIVANNNGDDLDPVAATDSQTSTFTPGASVEAKLQHTSFFIDAADMSNGNGVIACKLERDAVAGADTHTSTFDLVMIEIDYV